MIALTGFMEAPCRLMELPRMQGDHLKSLLPTYSFKCWYGISAKTAGTAFKKLQANILVLPNTLLLPTYIALINTGEWKRRQEKRDANNDKTPQKPGAESSHEIVRHAPLHCTTWPLHPRAPTTEAGHGEELFSSKHYRWLMHQAQPLQGLHICF